MIDLTAYKGDNEAVNYWLILGSYCQDEARVLVGVLDQLENAYKNAKANPPSGLREDLNTLRKKAKSQLSTLIAQKRRALEQLRQKPEKSDLPENQDTHKKKTRTEEIFGTEF